MLMIPPFNRELRMPQENRPPGGEGSSLAVIVTLSIRQRGFGHHVASWVSMLEQDAQRRKRQRDGQMRARATGRAWFAPSCSSINKFIHQQKDGLEVGRKRYRFALTCNQCDQPFSRIIGASPPPGNRVPVPKFPISRQTRVSGF
jgi:hypothetical protein